MSACQRAALHQAFSGSSIVLTGGQSFQYPTVHSSATRLLQALGWSTWWKETKAKPT
jgi:hypothetical protein